MSSRREKLQERLKAFEDDGAKRSLGQNFLISDTVVERILAAARSLPFPQLIEVGPGLGAITDDLLKLGVPLTVIELDRRFAEMWRARTEVQVIEADALHIDWRALELPPETLFVSNLPYQISSSIVIDRCVEPAGITRMILMFQKEVAQRIAARPGGKEYGLLTVIAQAFWRVSTVCDAGPRDFFPPPNVSSRVLMFKRRQDLDWLTRGEGTAQGLLKFAKLAYAHRRKLLASNVRGSWSMIDSVLEEQGLKPTARAEELDPDAFVSLYLAMEKRRV